MDFSDLFLYCHSRRELFLNMSRIAYPQKD